MAAGRGQVTSPVGGDAPNEWLPTAVQFPSSAAALAFSFVSVEVFNTNGSAMASWPSGTATTASGNSKRPRVSVCQANRVTPPSRALGAS